MKYHKGFILLELVLYILALGFFAYIFSIMMYQLWNSILIHNKKREQLMVLHTASDIFRRDIHEASSDEKHWKERDKQAIIWHTSPGDIGWKQEGHRLIRITGHYSCSKQQWSGSTKSVIVQHIKEINFLIKGHKKIDNVVLDMKTDYVSLNVLAIPCVRRLP